MSTNERIEIAVELLGSLKPGELTQKRADEILNDLIIRFGGARHAE